LVKNKSVLVNMSVREQPWSRGSIVCMA